MFQPRIPLQLVIAVAVILSSTLANAQLYTDMHRYTSYVAQLSGKNQVPTTVQSAATGVLTLNVDVATKVGYYTFRWERVAARPTTEAEGQRQLCKYG